MDRESGNCRCPIAALAISLRGTAGIREYTDNTSTLMTSLLCSSSNLPYIELLMEEEEEREGGYVERGGFRGRAEGRWGGGWMVEAWV